MVKPNNKTARYAAVCITTDGRYRSDFEVGNLINALLNSRQRRMRRIIDIAYTGAMNHVATSHDFLTLSLSLSLSLSAAMGD